MGNIQEAIQEEIMGYEVHSNYGGATFKNEDDAITALWLLGAYHEIEIERETVKNALERDCYFEAFPLSIIKGI